MKRRTLASAAAALVGLAALSSPLSSAARRMAPPQPDTRLGALMAVSVVDRSSGRELAVYRHRGEFWVAGRPGARYAIRVHNTQRWRLMAVMSVDGVNVVSGETAGLDQNGYVLDGGERADITGWRKSDSQVAAFEFTSLGNSYASRTGRPDNVGVIGVAVFRERPAPEPEIARPAPPRRDAERSEAQGAPMRERRADSAAADERASAAPMAESNAQAKSMAPAAPAPSLGTGHGRRENSQVGHTTFERLRSTPDEVIRIRYDSRENLVAAGIIPAPPPVYRGTPSPSPFPGSDAGYVPDPPPRRY